jgi:serine-type D-Ala-D-Ala carboxypeptidase/endopeptidase (penicillin-binding protein 4)
MAPRGAAMSAGRSGLGRAAARALGSAVARAAIALAAGALGALLAAGGAAAAAPQGAAPETSSAVASPAVTSAAVTAQAATFAPRSAPAPIASTIAAQRLPAGAVSFAVVDAESGRVIASQNGDTPRSPASTIKAVTTFVALDLLGPAYTWHTRALVRGELRGGVLRGDLILRGGGDPYMTLERWWSFVQALRARGLESIRGDIVVDDTAFAPAPDDPGAFDGRPHRAYNAQPYALMVNFQSVEFRLIPNALTRAIDITATPAPPNLGIDNRVVFIDGRCSAAAARVDFEVPTEAWDRVVFSGALSRDCAERSITRVLLKAPSYAYGTFVQLWRESGGTFEGKQRIEPAAPDAEPFLSFDSLTLGEIVRLTNKFSNNLMARHLLLTLGAERYGPPATLEKGADAIADWARARGLALPGLEIDNGSGLSRATRISALEMASILKTAFHSRYAPEFIASLPLAGIDGTLRSRMQDTAAGSVRLKTGHIDGVSGVAGYVAGAAGRTYVLVSLVNDARCDYGAAEPVHAALVDWIQQAL